MHTKEDLLYTTILIVSIIIGIIIACFLLSVIWQQRKFRKLNQQKIEIEIYTLENERKRIAADLHDELGAVLSAMKFKLESIDSASAADQLEVGQCVDLASEIMAKIRWITNALMPPTLIHHGIVSAINEFVRKVNHDHSQLEIIFACAGIPELPVLRSVHIFRMLQEIIHNTMKHAKAGSLKIELFTENDKLVILTADDGAGFDYDSAVREKKGLGLDTLQNRADLLGGEFHLMSVPGSGTRYHIRIPL
jgi:signal transduction histidine kinase